MSLITSGRYEDFEVKMKDVHHLDNEDLIYAMLSQDDDRYWEWAWDNLYNLDTYDDGAGLGYKVLYDRRDVDLSETIGSGIIQYMMSLPEEERDYEYIGDVIAMADEMMSIKLILYDPKLLSLQLERATDGVFNRDYIQFLLEEAEDLPPSDATDEVTEILEEWLETHPA